MKAIKTFSEAQIRAMLSYKPKIFYKWRVYVVLCFLVDTGARIDETLSLKPEHLNLARELSNRWL
jgi:integrase